MTRIDTRKEFFTAVADGNLEVVRGLFAENNDKTDSNGRTALMYAVIFNKLEVVKYLISQNVDLSAKDRAGKSALDYAAQKPEIAAIINQATSNLFPTLVQAIVEGDESRFVRGVCEQHAIQKDGEGRTLLMYAAQHGRLNIVRKLRELGADFLEWDKDGKSVLDYAYERDYAQKIDTISCVVNEIASRAKNLESVRLSLSDFTLPEGVTKDVVEPAPAPAPADAGGSKQRLRLVPRSPTPNTVTAPREMLDDTHDASADAPASSDLQRGVKGGSLLQRVQGQRSAKKGRHL